MSRYIDADLLLAQCRRNPLFEETEEDKRMVYIERSIINATPTADVVEVVRCKDCKYGNFLIQDGQEIVSCTNEAPPFADYFCPPMRLDDFCSYGERREE